MQRGGRRQRPPQAGRQPGDRAARPRPVRDGAQKWHGALGRHGDAPAPHPHDDMTDPGRPTGTPETRLIVIRGNSGSGKSTIARRLQRGHGRGCALVEQDYLRRIVLRERDLPGGIAPALIEQTVRFALDHGYHAVLEGILFRDKYGAMLTALRAAHQGRTSVFYLDVSLDETLRRHTTRPQAAE